MKKSQLSIAILASCSLYCSAASEPVPQLGKDSVTNVIKAMTLDEKIMLVIGTGMDFPGLPADMQGPVVGKSGGKVLGAAGTTAAIPRLGIPSLVMADGPAGVRIEPQRPNDKKTYFATAFPVGTSLASTWNTELVAAVGEAMGHEVKEYGIDIFLAPALNIQRIPLGGRNFEYYSEDPVVSGKIAAAMVRGIQSNGVAATIKHYVANNEEWNRNTINEFIDERALREIYLRGFEITVKESNPWAVMSSYNKVNGEYTSESPRLLTDILREQWGYNGMVMTDWFGGRNAPLQMHAGNDLLMPGTKVQMNALKEAVASGQLKMVDLDRNIQNILTLALKSPTYKKYVASDAPNLQKNAIVARAAAAEGVVLLKNNTALPLASSAKLALFGNASYDVVTGGTGSGDVNEAYSVSLLQGLKDAGYTLDDAFTKTYLQFIAAEKTKLPATPMFLAPPPITERNLSLEEIKAQESKSSVAVITIGRRAGEFNDRKENDDFKFTDAEQKLIKNVADVFHASKKKVVVILNTGGSVEMSSWQGNVDGILAVWQPGQEAGHAIADVLTGTVNPSGKLTSTFAVKLQDFPSAKNFPGKVVEAGDPNDRSIFAGAKAAEVTYEDSIWVGYRYFNSKKITQAYPFGFGLSYTKFAYTDMQISSPQFNENVTVSVKVTNTGAVAGKEVVQLYVAAPKGKLEKPVQELRAFAKTKLLQPKESQVVTFTVSARDFTSYDADAKQWVADAGVYNLIVAASSTDVRQMKKLTLPVALRVAP